MGYRLHYKRMGAFPHRCAFYLYKTGWFKEDFMNCFSTRQEAEEAIKQDAIVLEYYIDYDRHGNVDSG